MSQSLSPELHSSKAKEPSSTGFRNFKRSISEITTAIKSVRKKVSSSSKRTQVKIRQQEEVIAEEILQEGLSSSSVASDGETFIAASATPSAAWSNWAETQSANPAQIFYPETMEDLVEIIHQAKTANKKVRCACNGHTWSSSSVVQEEGYLAIMNKMEKIYNPVRLEGNVWTVEIETGVLVKDLDDLLRKHNPPLTLPSNVVLETVRYGGVLSLGCHGAATHTRTLPDLVHSVKIVDANGHVNVFSKDVDPVEFSAATVNLGLLGIIYSYTLRVEPMFKLRVTDTFPLFKDYFSSPELSGPKLKAMVESNDQTEIFYWPFNTGGLGIENDRLWVKQWQRTDVLPVTESYKHATFQKALQNLGTSFGSKLYEYMAAHPSSTPFLCCLMYSALRTVEGDPKLVDTIHGGEEGSEEVLHAPDAIHFQGGIDNMKCLDLEMAFKVDENFENVVKAWTFVTDKMYQYAERGEFPLNLTMEMRFVKSSQMTMSNAYDDDPEAIYCMIEILSVANTQGFTEFSAMVAKYWMDEFQARPHWAKMWEHIPGIVPYLREYSGARARLDEFERIRKKYDPEGMFMNRTFAGLLGH